MPREHYWRPGDLGRPRSRHDSSYGVAPSGALDDDSSALGDSITVNYNPLRHLPIRRQRELLPITPHRLEFLWALETSRVVIVVGATGCGKSTQLPQYVLDSGWLQENEVVFVVVPRRVAASSLAGRTAEERGCGVGAQVGYITSDQSAVSAGSRIIYVTDGVLLRLVQNDPLLLRGRVLILDDCHDRRLNCDLLMSIFKRITKFRPDLRLVLCSATIHVQTFVDFFSSRSFRAGSHQLPEKEASSNVEKLEDVSSDSKKYNFDKEALMRNQDCLKDVSVVEILSDKNGMFPVTIFYLKHPCNDYLIAAMETVLDIHAKYDISMGHILVFLCGRDEIEELGERLEQAIAESKNFRNPLEVAQLYGGLPNDLQLRALRPTRRSGRKVVLSTNVAESSITIEGIGFVVDSGFQRLNVTDYESGVEILCELPISRASARQRAGRAGRTQGGMCFRLYPETANDEDIKRQHTTGFDSAPASVPRLQSWSMPDFEVPEVTRCNLTPAVLYLLSLGVENFVFDFDLPSPVTSESVAAALSELHALEAIDELGRLTKPMGLRMAMLPLSPISSRFVLLSAKDFSCSYEAIIIASMLHAGSPWIVPHARTRAKLDILTAAQLDIGVKEGDLVTLYNIYKQAEHYQDDDPGWIERHQISKQQLRRADKMKKQIERAFSDWNLPIASTGSDVANLTKAICAGFFYNAAQRQADGSYRLLRSDITKSCKFEDQLQRLGKFYVEPRSICSGSSPLYIVFTSALSTSSSVSAVVEAANRGEEFCILLSGISPIDPRWLGELAGHYFVLDWLHQIQPETQAREG